MNYPSLTHLKAMAKIREANEYSAEKRTVRDLLAKHFEKVAGINIIKQNGVMVAVMFAAKNNGNKHYTQHKAGIHQTEGRVELLEVVNT